MVHVPAPVKLTVAPEIVHTADELASMAKVTGFPDAPPVAVTVYVAPPTVAPLGEAFCRRELSERPERHLVDSERIAETGEQLGSVLEECVGVFDGQCRGRVEVRQVADLIADRPSRTRRVEFPLFGGELGDDDIECSLLSDEIVQYSVDIHADLR